MSDIECTVPLCCTFVNDGSPQRHREHRGCTEFNDLTLPKHSLRVFHEANYQTMTNPHSKLRTTRKVLTALLIISWLTTGTAQQSVPYRNPVIAGDRPDPSVIRVGRDYWATTTSGSWEPQFSLFHSLNLLSWNISGAVFQKRPDWAERDFWAPEISEDHGRFFVYYTARKKGGPLCVAVATASSP